jgi:hypothetical protein
MNMVLKRQIAHEKKLDKNPDHREAFDKNFFELIKEKYVREATAQDLLTKWINVNYLPMSLVINENKTPVKYRNVFDAAATYQGTSLNKNLLKGPDELIDILKPLLNMRLKKVAFTADIKSMFHRIKINLRDQQCQRILWRESSESEMKIFIMTSMLFGPTCSPFQSQFVKNWIAAQWQYKYPRACEKIQQFMFMDDLLTAEETEDEAYEIAIQCIEIFKSINWELVAFQSNNVNLLKRLPNTNVKQEMIPLLEN